MKKRRLNNNILEVHPKIDRIIDKVDQGLFDDILEQLEGSHLGIHASAYVERDTVKPIPHGYGQTESDLKISISSHDDNQSENSVQVGWYGPVPVDCKEKSLQGAICEHCKSHCFGHGQKKLGLTVGKDEALVLQGSDCTGTHCARHGPSQDIKFNVLKEAQELHPKEISERVAEHNDLLANLQEHGLGIFICHGHNKKYEFTELPINCVAVIRDNQTQFVSRDTVACSHQFVPNFWRFENGIRQPVGGFSL